MDDLDVLPIWPDVQLDHSATPLQRVYNRHRAAVACQLIPHKIRVVGGVPVVVGEWLAHIMSRHLKNNSDKTEEERYARGMFCS
jgi:hypothetical protein